MGICYLHSGSDKPHKKCCDLHRIRDVVRLIPYTTADLGNYKKRETLYYGELNNNNRIRRLIAVVW